VTVDAGKTLQQRLKEDLGARHIGAREIPAIVTANLREDFTVRPYQLDALRYFLSHCDEGDGERQLLFHMATGSGKTLIMAALILILRQRGFRDFLFFVNSTNVLEKTRDNFLNPSSSKYLFAQRLTDGERRFSIREAGNFQAGGDGDVNIVFTTIQGLHAALENPAENGLTYEDFEGRPVVMISDEAHHINASTKKSEGQGELGLGDDPSWEQTVERIFRAHPATQLLEFTATIDFSDPKLAAKYRPKLIYDYPLRAFRADGYSKEVRVLQADLPPLERALQAAILSQYRRKLFERSGLRLKPVVMLKSRTIAESKAFRDSFEEAIRTLSGETLAAIGAAAAEARIGEAFAWFGQAGLSLANIALELREDFAPEKLIEVNSKEESETRQLAVNSLEDPDNEYRAVFAVDKLNEGWDVLNLFDIVRLYDTRDAKAGKTGRTTMSEAQLIGRGARYCPFRLAPDQPLDRRKYDEDLGNELRICEELVYHSAHNPKYVQELNEALREIGLKPREQRERDVRLKASFRATDLYRSGHVWLNRRVRRERPADAGLGEALAARTRRVELGSGASLSSLAFEEGAADGAQPGRRVKRLRLGDLDLSLLRKAAQRLDFYEFRNLRHYFPELASMREFLTADSYLGRVRVEIAGEAGRIDALGREDLLHAATRVLDGLAGDIVSSRTEYRGTKDFAPHALSEIIVDKRLSFAADTGSDREWGRSMNDPADTAIHLDLAARDWFAFEDCFGTAEEKHLIRFIDARIDELRKSFSDMFLIRNERHFKIYAFDDGAAFEPDFLLHLARRDGRGSLHYQIFIEPKGAHLLRQEAWKQDFLLRLAGEAQAETFWEDREVRIVGLPFYNRDQTEAAFGEALDALA
jgi:type III restriction enzyme